MVDTDATLTLSDPFPETIVTYTFLFRAVTPIDNRKSQNITSIDFVNKTPSNNFLFRFSGQTESLDFTFGIFNDNTDVSNGTAPGGTFPSGVKTVTEQMIWLRDYVFSANFEAYWTFTNANLYSSGVTVVIEDVSFDVKNSSLAIGTIRLRRGIINLGE